MGAYRVNKLFGNRVFHFEYYDKSSLARTMLRFQEHYEGAKYAGKIFTLGEYRKWYAETYGAFTYYSDWTGFNFPSQALDAFEEGLFDPLTREEEDVVDVLTYARKPYYVIGSPINQRSTCDHELCHAMFYLDSLYRKEAEKEIDKYGKKLDGLKKQLIQMGYHGGVWNDEINAYASTSSIAYLREKQLVIPERLRKQLKKMYRCTRHKNGLISNIVFA